MLNLWRTVGAYERAALVLLCDDAVIGEVIVLEVTGDGQVRLGLNLAPDIEIVRANAVHRPSGPSAGWLAQREADFRVCGPGPLMPCSPDDYPGYPGTNVFTYDDRDFGWGTSNAGNAGNGPDDGPDDPDEQGGDDDDDAGPDYELDRASPRAPHSTYMRPWGTPTTATPPALYTYRVQEGGRR